MSLLAGPRPSASNTMTEPDHRPELLLTPGPLTTSRKVKEAMLRDWGSRSAPFAAMTARVRERLLEVVGAPETHVCIPLQGSGTYAVEAALATLVPREGGKVLVTVNGVYGRRIGEICQALGLPHVILEFPEDEVVDPARVATALEAAPDVTHVALVHCETTSGLLNPLDAVAQVVQTAGRRLILDAISTLGAIPLDIGEVPVEAVVASANKGLEGTPGFAVVFAEASALAATAGNARSLSLDLQAQHAYMERTGQWRFTPPTHAVAALDQALVELAEEGGVPGRNARYSGNMEVLRAGLRELGFETFLRDGPQAPVILSLLEPTDPAFDFSRLAAALASRGIMIYPGAVTQAPTFRVGCIGRLDEGDIRRALEAFRESIEELELEPCPFAAQLAPPELSSEQLEAYRRDGFLIVPGAFSPDAARLLGIWAEDLAGRPEESGRHWVYHESDSSEEGELLNRIENVAPFHAGFSVLTQVLAPSASRALGEPAYLFKEKINYKRPGGAGFEPHQDVQAGWDDYAPRFVTTAVCLDEATEENGCLELVAGRHEEGKLRGREPLTAEDLGEAEFRAFPTRPGDLILFDGHTPHRSGPNHTDAQRRMYFATYNGASAGDQRKRYLADKYRSYPPDIDREPGREYRYEI
jgi:2-aminoethylphosphonate-pyruvate transaminase